MLFIATLYHNFVICTYFRLGGLMDKALDLRIRGREFESRYGQEFIIL